MVPLISIVNACLYIARAITLQNAHRTFLVLYKVILPDNAYSRAM